MSAVDQMSQDVRAKSIGASESAMIAGLSPFGDGQELYYRKKGIKTGIPQTEAMARGNRQEAFVATEAAAWFGQGAEIRLQQFRIHHKQHDYISATLDGMAFVGMECLGVTEFKTINQNLWVTPPDYYKCQVIHQMYVTEQAKGHLFAWSTKESKLGHWEFLWADHKDWWTDEILPQLHTFWNEHILKDIPPAGKPKRERTWADLPNALLTKYADLGDHIKLMEDERKMIKQQIMDALGNPEENLCMIGDSFKIDVKRIETNRVNTKKIPADIAEAAKELSVSYRLDVQRVGLKAK